MTTGYSGREFGAGLLDNWGQHAGTPAFPHPWRDCLLLSPFGVVCLGSSRLSRILIFSTSSRVYDVTSQVESK